MSPRSLPPQVVAALKAGHKIEAIKELRRATGLGLKEAEESVEAYVRGGSPAQPAHHAHAARPMHAAHILHASRHGLSPGEVPRVGGAGKWLVLAAVAAVLIGAALYR